MQIVPAHKDKTPAKEARDLEQALKFVMLAQHTHSEMTIPTLDIRSLVRFFVCNPTKREAGCTLAAGHL
jgi:hypothetical protein